MVYLEHKTINNEEYTYLTKNIRLSSNKWKKIRKYLEKKNPHINIIKAYNENKEYFIEEETKLKFQNGKKLDPDFNKLVLPKIIYDSVHIDNTLRINPQLKNEVEIEFAKEFIYNSNKMEGSTLPKEAFVAIFNRRKVMYQDKNEIQEAQNSIECWNYLRNNFKIDITSIKKLYQILTKNLLMFNKYKYPKGFKKIPNKIGHTETTPPNKVVEEMRKLVQWYKKNKKTLHPLKLAFEFYYKYESIHPFQDGNGRTGRMIMNRILMDASYPPIIIKDESKIDQAIAFKEYVNKKPEHFYKFLLNEMKDSYKIFYKKFI